MFITNTNRRDGLRPALTIMAALAAAATCSPLAVAATPVPRIAAAAEGVQRIDDYAAALEAARASGAMLLVSVEPQSGDPGDVVGQHLERPDVQERFGRSGTPWVFCRLGMAEAAGLVADPSLVEMRRGPGVFVVDHAHPRYAGRIVSILPRRAGKYYRFTTSHVDELAALPEGSLTQRSLILAVRIHPENPQSTQGSCDPSLCAEAESHSAHQARIRRQGHHGWDVRSQRRLRRQLAAVVRPLERRPQPAGRLRVRHPPRWQRHLVCDRRLPQMRLTRRMPRRPGGRKSCRRPCVPCGRRR